MIQPGDIYPLTDFLRNAKAYVRKLKKSGRPMLLTVNGKAELVMQDVRTYQKLLLDSAELKELKAVEKALARMRPAKKKPRAKKRRRR